LFGLKKAYRHLMVSLCSNRRRFPEIGHYERQKPPRLKYGNL
jgi:hypothetical protein